MGFFCNNRNDRAGSLFNEIHCSVIASEKAGKSVIPFSFWIFSLGGSALLLSYAIYRKDPVFILGQAPNLLIYSRNIYLIKKKGS